MVAAAAEAMLEALVGMVVVALLAEHAVEGAAPFLPSLAALSMASAPEVAWDVGESHQSGSAWGGMEAVEQVILASLLSAENGLVAYGLHATRGAHQEQAAKEEAEWRQKVLGEGPSEICCVPAVLAAPAHASEAPVDASARSSLQLPRLRP